MRPVRVRNLPIVRGATTAEYTCSGSSESAKYGSAGSAKSNKPVRRLAVVSAARAFIKEPPKAPLKNCKRIAKDFKWRYKDRKLTDQVVEFCRLAPDFNTAIDRAVEARDANGKHHNHQSKVDITARRKLGKRMKKRKKQFLRLINHAKATSSKKDPEWLTSPFDALHDFIDEIKPKGIGPVTVYDVAVRVGAFLEVEPTSVYLHAGVKQGLKTLQEAIARQTGDGFNDFTDPKIRQLKRVPMYLFPPPFNKMKADDVEDILCTYREVFESW